MQTPEQLIADEVTPQEPQKPVETPEEKPNYATVEDLDQYFGDFERRISGQLAQRHTPPTGDARKDKLQQIVDLQYEDPIVAEEARRSFYMEEIQANAHQERLQSVAGSRPFIEERLAKELGDGLGETFRKRVQDELRTLPVERVAEFEANPGLVRQWNLQLLGMERKEMGKQTAAPRANPATVVGSPAAPNMDSTELEEFRKGFGLSPEAANAAASRAMQEAR